MTSQPNSEEHVAWLTKSGKVTNQLKLINQHLPHVIQKRKDITTLVASSNIYEIICSIYSFQIVVSLQALILIEFNKFRKGKIWLGERNLLISILRSIMLFHFRASYSLEHLLTLIVA